MASELYKIPPGIVMEDQDESATVCSSQLETAEIIVCPVPGSSKAHSVVPPLPPVNYTTVRPGSTSINMYPGVEKAPFMYPSATPQDSWAPMKVLPQLRIPENGISLKDVVREGLGKMAQLLYKICGEPVPSNELYFLHYVPSPQQEVVYGRSPCVYTRGASPTFAAPQTQPTYTMETVRRQAVAAPAQTVLMVPASARASSWAVHEFHKPLKEQPAARPDPQKLLCFGHQGDERKLCFGLLTLPPRQIKYDFVTERTPICFDMWSKDTFVAVCRKCRQRLSKCPHCHKQSVIFHP
ncbi:hypothetical protein TGME49_202930 [Toxoplasma gondii ME49]|uniref:Uncharacterized protein n=1 Tax=Toxoplasma gondii (strain ATCC 50611 / Me49) TaxID=508771 RepID=S8GEB0_TOXGM|nr:hypothetical protein TGME49_202930 [Toxoplasma gondii ME49]EPT30175.1 hypothetical protein TGME49_202930 [Toxoplasma gondii ME49]|eukprot:XP_002367575.1 hypothetical protein TGME49_202930 [Toxoplasma gondii ME49]